MSINLPPRVHFPIQSAKNNNRNITTYLRVSVTYFNLKGYGYVRVVCSRCNRMGPYLVWTSAKGPREIECMINDCQNREYDSNDLIIQMFVGPAPENTGTIYLNEPIF